jgi:hypothetical protein
MTFCPTAGRANLLAMVFVLSVLDNITSALIGATVAAIW